MKHTLTTNVYFNDPRVATTLIVTVGICCCTISYFHIKYNRSFELKCERLAFSSYAPIDKNMEPTT